MLLEDPDLTLTSEPLARRRNRLRRLHSITGTLPLGAFLILHLWVNQHALRGQRSFDAVVNTTHRIPLVAWLEILCIYLPLAFHSIYGIRLTFTALPKHAGATKSWADILQRVTGGVALLFIVFHFCQFRLQVFLGRMQEPDFFSELCASLSSTNSLGIPIIAFGYLLGIAACAFHFANGLANFCFSWEIAVSKRARQVTIVLTSVLGVVLFLIGAMTTLYFATGSALLTDAPPAPIRNHGD